MYKVNNDQAQKIPKDNVNKSDLLKINERNHSLQIKACNLLKSLLKKRQKHTY